ncbi:hypothetical protein [Paenibacillus rubinfantis]|uniref:hypothetical protein n=1 Tax=Paenibacillus rubinfantis TaxID=1720296 RepID=UPI00073E324A|nr:hypothetical protein [Paenibacillus rubinfantis]
MRKNTLDVLIFMAMAFMFVGALTNGILQYNQTSRTLDLTYDTGQKFDRNVSTTRKITPEYTVTGAQVLQSINLIADIGCNIIVRSGASQATFLPTLDIHNTNVSIVNLSRTYKPTYNRGADGSLTSIVFVMQ